MIVFCSQRLCTKKRLVTAAWRLQPHRLMAIGINGLGQAICWWSSLWLPPNRNRRGIFNDRLMRVVLEAKYIIWHILLHWPQSFASNLHEILFEWIIYTAWSNSARFLVQCLYDARFSTHSRLMRDNLLFLALKEDFRGRIHDLVRGTFHGLV